MKNNKIILLLICMMVFGLSCEEDGGSSQLGLEDGAVPNMVNSTTGPAFIDLVEVAGGNIVTIGFNASVAQGNPASANLIAVYNTFAGDVYYTVLETGISLPQDFTLTSADIIAAFPEITGNEDFQVGDVLTLTTQFVMDDGRVLDIVNEDGTSNTGTNIQTTVLFNSVVNYPVACTSDLGGVHSFVSTNFQAVNSTTACPTGETTGTVTWTDQGGGVYLTSDLGFGQYGTTCWSDTPATSGGATFTDACNLIISGGLDQYGLAYTWEITDVSGPELSISWVNNYGDSGDVVITREGGEDWPELSTTVTQ
ncbi:MAG: hypothetical protein ABJN84_15640 [Flavobacteriaceae bacterium]